MFYHASNIKDLKILKPHISSHGKSWVYFSSKRENILVYLSNAVEKYIKEKYNRPLKHYEKWASYGIANDGRVRIEEYYPNATRDTFEGVSGYIYMANNLTNAQPLRGIKDVFVTHDAIWVDKVEYISDAYAEILQAEKDGKIIIERFNDITQQKREWIIKTMTNELENTDNDDYKDFILNKFDWIFNEKKD